MRFADLTWEDVAAADKARFVVILPVGAIEAHGPHLPLGTDILIADAMAESGARALEKRGFQALVLPALPLAVADFAAEFAGTLSLRPETAAAVLRDLAAALAGHGIKWLVVANAHLDPAHIESLQTGLADAPLTVVFPDVTRKPWASGSARSSGAACHAGATRGRSSSRSAPISCATAGRRCPPTPRRSPARSVRAQDVHRGGGAARVLRRPAAASATEGRERIAELGAILAEAFLEAHGPS